MILFDASYELLVAILESSRIVEVSVAFAFLTVLASLFLAYSKKR